MTMTHLKAGDPAPKFHLNDQNDNGWSLGDFSGKWLALYFYPEDDTPGCTKEACAFRDAYAAYKSAGAKIVGVSPDTHESHSRFVDKYDLPFTLLADPTHEACDTYGVWGTKEHKGKTFEGVTRTTFLIDPDGKIAKVYPDVSPESHAQEVLNDIKQLQAAPTQ